MLIYPSINPVALSIGQFHIHWYGVMYLLGFLCFLYVGKWRIKHYGHPVLTPEMMDDFLFYGALGVILGGRLGYCLFYRPEIYLLHPLDLFKTWDGGMSFHGGLIGVCLGVYIFSRKLKCSFLLLMDFASVFVPIGLFFGRVGNFINGELWGKVTDVPWAMIFPGSDGQPRHPSQLYEFSLEGILLFILVWWYAAKKRPTGCVSAFFLVGYALCRLFIEFFREPDPQLGYLAFNWVTMGQLLSVPMLIAGLWLWWVKR